MLWEEYDRPHTLRNPPPRATLLQLGHGHIVKREPRCAAELVYERVQHAVLVIGRAEIAQSDMRLGLEPLLQCCDDARLAEAGFAGNQYDLAVARLGTRPAPQQQVDLIVPKSAMRVVALSGSTVPTRR